MNRMQALTNLPIKHLRNQGMIFALMWSHRIRNFRSSVTSSHAARFIAASNRQHGLFYAAIHHYPGGNRFYGEYDFCCGKGDRMRQLLFFLGLMLASVHANAELPSAVARELKKAGIPQQDVAVYVQAVEAKRAILTHNAQKSMNPASVMKTGHHQCRAGFADAYYRWKTEVYRDGNVIDGVLTGNLIIKGLWRSELQGAGLLATINEPATSRN